MMEVLAFDTTYARIANTKAKDHNESLLVPCVRRCEGALMPGWKSAQT